MRIGIDFDDVIFDFTPEFIRHVNITHGTEYAFESHFSFHLDEVWNISQEEALRRVDDFVFSSRHRNTPAIEGAKETLPLLRDKHELFIVTGRSEHQKQATHAWIDEHVPNIFKSVTFTNLFSDSPDAKKVTKAEVCDELQLDYFIEDAVLHTEIIAKTKTHVYLFDRPWNRTVHHPNMTRIFTWYEIQKLLLP